MENNEIMRYHEALERHYSNQLDLASRGVNMLEKMPVLREGISRGYLSQTEVEEAILRGIELRSERKKEFSQELKHALTALATNHDLDINLGVVEEGKKIGAVSEEDVRDALTVYDLSRGSFLNL